MNNYQYIYDSVTYDCGVKRTPYENYWDYVNELEKHAHADFTEPKDSPWYDPGKNPLTGEGDDYVKTGKDWFYNNTDEGRELRRKEYENWKRMVAKNITDTYKDLEENKRLSLKDAVDKLQSTDFGKLLTSNLLN